MFWPPVSPLESSALDLQETVSQLYRYFFTGDLELPLNLLGVPYKQCLGLVARVPAIITAHVPPLAVHCPGIGARFEEKLDDLNVRVLRCHVQRWGMRENRTVMSSPGMLPSLEYNRLLPPPRYPLLVLPLCVVPLGTGACPLLQEQLGHLDVGRSNRSLEWGSPRVIQRIDEKVSGAEELMNNVGRSGLGRVVQCVRVALTQESNVGVFECIFQPTRQERVPVSASARKNS